MTDIKAHIELWEADEYVVILDGRGVVGRTLSKSDAATVARWLPSAVKDINGDLVKRKEYDFDADMESVEFYREKCVLLQEHLEAERTKHAALVALAQEFADKDLDDEDIPLAVYYWRAIVPEWQAAFRAALAAITSDARNLSGDDRLRTRDEKVTAPDAAMSRPDTEEDAE